MGVIAVIGAVGALAEVMADGLLIAARARGTLSDAAYGLLIVTGVLCTLVFPRLFQVSSLGRAHRNDV